MKPISLNLHLLVFISLIAGSLSAQSADTTATPETFNLVLGLDNAFGFNPAVYGSFGLDAESGASFTYYAIFWTNPSYGTFVDGSDLWLETGAGIGFTGLSGRLYLNPSIGLTHGKLLSDSPRGVPAEGIVPSMVAVFTEGRFEAEGYFAWYKALLNKGRNSGDYLLYWILPGIRVSERVALGLHYEGFDRIRHAGGDTGSQYAWFGGYLKFNLSNRYIFRFSAGSNSAKNGIYSDSFYKLAVTIGLP
ncbi:MAG TPA: hypothetical protein PKE06_23530 [Flavilitoribacter sp.]|nr:hypothetical protein [Flavilitoribacter sp.]HMQ89662.1 hypothetical protein [Flavilitoribacter sp.]